LIGGVCGGLAEYSGIDVVLWRLGVVVAALFGVGVVLYLVLWIIMPLPACGSRATGRVRRRLPGYDGGRDLVRPPADDLRAVRRHR
jgi:hypothetical protein